MLPESKKQFTKYHILALLAILLMGLFFITSAAEAAGPAETLVIQTESGGSIYAVNADGSNLRYLTTGIDPALSPDGQWVAFTRWDSTSTGADGSLWVIGIDGQNERQILGEIHQPKAPAWSPDGSQITISMQQGGQLGVESHCEPFGSTIPRNAYDINIGSESMNICYKLPADTHWKLRVVNVADNSFEDVVSDIYSYAPVWDPANDWHVVYDGDLGLVNLDLNRQVTWTLTDDANDHTPAISPDGSQVAVAYKQHDHWNIHVMNADGSGRVQLTDTPLYVTVTQNLNGQETKAWNNVSPVWSPDGAEIAFLTDRSGEWEVWVMNADGSNQHPMFSDAVNDQLTLNVNYVDEKMLSWQ